MLAVLAVLAGCTAKYQVSNLAGAGGAHLDRSIGVYVTLPQDGAFGTTTAAGSGQIVAQAVATAFAGVGARVHVAEKTTSNDQAMTAARGLNAGYLAVPVITQWEQRATEWSGRPSRMAIRLNIIDVASGNQIASSAIEGRSRIVSFAYKNLPVLGSTNEALLALDRGYSLHSPIRIRLVGKSIPPDLLPEGWDPAEKNGRTPIIRTTIGRVIFNTALPKVMLGPAPPGPRTTSIRSMSSIGM